MYKGKAITTTVHSFIHSFGTHIWERVVCQLPSRFSRVQR